MKYIYVLLVAIVNYAITFFIGYLVSTFLYLELKVIPLSIIFVLIYTINIVIVFIEWILLNKFFKELNVKFEKSVNIKTYILLLILPTILFLSYKIFVNDFVYIEIINSTQVLFYILSNIILVPIIEEILYRDILIKILLNKGSGILFTAIFTSFLFSLTHLVPDDIDMLYLVYIFLNGMVLFYIRIKNNLFFAIISHSIINLVVYFFEINMW